jgi:di- and tripeptidase
MLTVAGAQNTSIEWVNFSEPRPPRTRKISSSTTSTSITQPLADTDAENKGVVGNTKPQRTGRYKPHKFFDISTAAGGPSSSNSGPSTPRTPNSSSPTPAKNDYFSKQDVQELEKANAENYVIELEVAVEATITNAHYGYVYAIRMIERPDGSRWLVSGSGDCDVKVWLCKPRGGLQFLREFTSLSGAVLSLSFRDSLLYAGLQDGEIVVWDLETSACIRTVEAHECDVLTMAVLGTDVYTGAADGKVLRLDGAFDCTAAFRGHAGTVMDSCVIKGKTKGRWELITAGNDSFVKVRSRCVQSLAIIRC